MLVHNGRPIDGFASRAPPSVDELTGENLIPDINLVYEQLDLVVSLK